MQPVVRSLRVLRAVATTREGASLQVLSRRLNIPIASVHRILAVLENEQYVVRSEVSKRYFVGPALRELATAQNPPGRNRAPAVVHPALAEVVDATGETAFITEFRDGRAACVSYIEGRYPLRLFVHIGQDMPLHAAASARVLLSGLADDEVRTMLEATSLVPFTTETPQSVSEVMRRVAVARSRGYDLCDEELDRGVWVVAAPVRGRSDAIVAALSLALPIDRAGDVAQRQRLTVLVREAAQRMTETDAEESRLADDRSVADR
ncbi:IclR family transcriptional regulator [Streptomyces sp. Agncl-13]|uniref:IclR family transcriptional regulator n=1 Tax=Streptomyces sp. Agncl-13 TaxID=3400628 RepID=UPI003A8359A7